MGIRSSAEIHPDASRDERGAAAVEFAMVLPLLLVMLIGIFEFGRAWNIFQVITDTAREGARMAVVQDGQNKQTTVPAVIQDRLTSAGISWDGAVDYTATCTGWEPAAGSMDAVTVSGCGWGRATGGEEARVAIRAPYPFVFLRPLLLLLPGESSVGPTLMTTHFVMRNE
jgi:Flp pilus assembly pilin Flp